MTKLLDIVTSIELGDGESIVVKVDPSVDVTERPGRFAGSTTYTIPCILANGKHAKLSGGSRLLAAVQEKAAQAVGAVANLRITAKGKAGTTDRDWDISLLPGD